MKQYFTGGLLLLLPLIITFAIINFILNFLTEPFLASIHTLTMQQPSLRAIHFISSEGTLFIFIIKLLILFFICCFIFVIGVIGRPFLIDPLFRTFDYLLHRLPLINKIYRASKEIVHSLFSSSSKKFSSVVLVPFPHENNLSIGFVTGEVLKQQNNTNEENLFVSVFVPGTPNPSFGFLLLFRKDQLFHVNMKVEEAMKCLMSCGALMPDFSIVQPAKDPEPLFTAKEAMS